MQETSDTLEALQISVEALERDIVRAKSNGSEPFMIAIDGRSGSGKSTIADFLSSRMNALIVHGDDFYAGGVGIRDETPKELADICIDWQRLRTVLTEIRQEGSSRFAAFDWNAFDGSLEDRPKEIAARPVVVVEGVYSGRPELKGCMDYQVLVNTPSETRMKRLEIREGRISDWERQWHRAEDWYFDTVALPDRFDFIIQNT